MDAREARGIRSQRVTPDGCDPRTPFAGRGQKLDGGGSRTPRRYGEPGEPRVEGLCRRQRSGARHHVPAGQLTDLDPLEIHGATRSRLAEATVGAVALDAANPTRDSRGMDLDRVTHAEWRAEERAGDHAAEALCREVAVDGQARGATARGARTRSGDRGDQCFAQRVEPGAGDRGTGTMGVPANGDSRSRSATSSAASSATSASTASIFESATTPQRIPSSSQIATCSRV